MKVLSQRLLKITKQWLVILPKQPKMTKSFILSAHFFVSKELQRIELPVTDTTGAGSISRPSVVKKLENHVYLIGGTTSLRQSLINFKIWLTRRKKQRWVTLDIQCKLLLWLVDAKNNKTYGPFLAEYILNPQAKIQKNRKRTGFGIGKQCVARCWI